MKEQTRYTCPICGYFEIKRVEVAGQSDGDDGKSKMHPDNCPKCQGWQEASPVLYAKMRYHFERAETIKEQTEKRVHASYNEHISKYEIAHALCEPCNSRARKGRAFAECERLNEISEAPFSEWVIGNAAETAVNLFLHQLRDEAKRKQLLMSGR